MSTLLLNAIIALAMLSHVQAQKSLGLKFEDYPVNKKFVSVPISPKIDSKRAKQFRTQIKNQSKGQPNFAGHYFMAIWGCGTGCLEFAVIDADTGQVYFHPKAIVVTTILCNDDEPIEFRLESSLLVLAGRIHDRNKRYQDGKFYYLWKNDEFKLIHMEKLHKEC